MRDAKRVDHEPGIAGRLNRRDMRLLLVAARAVGRDQAVQMPPTPTFWNRCGVATADDG